MIPDFVPMDSRPGEFGLVTRADVVAEARMWLHVPYVHQGRSRDGLDCAGLPIVVARSLGLVDSDFDVTGYARSPDGTSLIDWCGQFMTRLPLHEAKPGHVFVIRWDRNHRPQHLGILCDYLNGGLSLIHALNQSNGKGRVDEHRLDEKWRSRGLAVFAFPEVEP